MRNPPHSSLGNHSRDSSSALAAGAFVSARPSSRRGSALEIDGRLDRALTVPSRCRCRHERSASVRNALVGAREGGGRRPANTQQEPVGTSSAVRCAAESDARLVASAPPLSSTGPRASADRGLAPAPRIVTTPRARAPVTAGRIGHGRCLRAPLRRLLDRDGLLAEVRHRETRAYPSGGCRSRSLEIPSISSTALYLCAGPCISRNDNELRTIP
mmetsp:Transcript_13243/g.53090  ORF Transcript_13243/g.53090 Transcript_13243/m.53090 type:complete len:215 (+) Transcript_13243:183-827(+)